MIGLESELAEQLVAEFTVRSLDDSLALYTALGFVLERRTGGFAALRWAHRRLFLDEQADLPAAEPARVNVRILVPDVDRLWALAHRLGLRVHQPIADRYYGLRDFTVLDADGFGLRFASPLGADVVAPERSAFGREHQADPRVGPPSDIS